MEFTFMDGRMVQLRSRRHGTYIHADDDWRGVSMRPERASLKAVWMVQRLQRGDTSYALLRSAAYGRYLASECCGQVIGQRDYNQPEQDDVLWEVFNAWPWDQEGDVFIRHGSQPRGTGYLRVNDDHPIQSSYWMVEVLLPRLEPPVLPRPVVEQPVELKRLIFYVLGDDLGRFGETAWQLLEFFGRSVHKLRKKLARQLNFASSRDITLCIKAGSQGRLTHLAIDLPARDLIEIVVLRTYSTADVRLRHPDLDSVVRIGEQDD